MSEFRSQKKLYRNRKTGKIGGVCAGLADYLDLDVVIVRTIAVCCLIFTLQVAFIVYVVAYFMMNDDPGTLRDERGNLRSQFRNSFERNSVLNSVHDRFGKVEKRLRSMEAYVTSSSFKLRNEIDGL